MTMPHQQHMAGAWRTGHLWLGSLAGGVLWFVWSLALGAGGDSFYDQLIGATARQHGLEPALVKAVIKCESRFDPEAVSPRGAQGLMQLMPATQSLLGVSDAFDPRRNIVAGVRYLAMLRQLFDGDVSLMLAAYNAGPQAVIAANATVPPFPETQRYVQCVLTALQTYRQYGLNEQFLTDGPAYTAEEGQLRISPLRFSQQVTLVGQRLTLQLEALQRGSQTTQGVVLLTYPEHLVSFMAIHAVGSDTTVRLPGATAGQVGKASWTSTAYQFIQGRWPAWQPGQRRTAVLALVPRLPQDIALHLSIFLYDATETTVQQRWSTVVRLPVRASPW
jgi:hypothetical protein